MWTSSSCSEFDMGTRDVEKLSLLKLQTLQMQLYIDVCTLPLHIRQTSFRNPGIKQLTALKDDVSELRSDLENITKHIDRMVEMQDILDAWLNLDDSQRSESGSPQDTLEPLPVIAPPTTPGFVRNKKLLHAYDHPRRPRSFGRLDGASHCANGTGCPAKYTAVRWVAFPGVQRRARRGAFRRFATTLAATPGARGS